jgi:hypothetical protein
VKNRKRASSSFLKKRTKKLLSVGMRCVSHSRANQRAKVFVSFFQKRNTSFLAYWCVGLPVRFREGAAFRGGSFREGYS